jgi:hypothetical protein
VECRDDLESRLDELVEDLNRLCSDGWRVVTVDLTAHSSFAVKALPVLLERDVPQMQA